MRCRRCGSGVDEKWKFCPKCGSILRRDFFSNVFERVGREMKEMDRSFERNFEVLDLSPFFRRPTKSGGFSIRITRSGQGKPKVSFKTFGDVDRKDVESEVSKLGLKEVVVQKTEKSETGIQLERAKVTKEPETYVKNLGDRIVVEVKLPGVSGEEDIQVKSLENSIEVKALAGDKAYFKILTKPEKANIVRKDFEDDVLRLEIV